MEPMLQTQTPRIQVTDPVEAWDRVSGILQGEISRSMYETWVQHLQPVSYQNSVFTLAVPNAYARDWVESRLKSKITRLLEGTLNADLEVELVVGDGKNRLPAAQPAAEAPSEETPPETKPGKAAPGGSSRKLMLQRAYGSKRASIIQPERGQFLTHYFFSRWTPLIGHSALAVILAARGMCYWNPLTGELRNTLETEMSELAERASVSVRTVKEVLNSELVNRYFLRYRVRRVMTPNGVRTAGILLQVRMDDPLTPEDQQAYSLPEEERWYSAEFEPLDDD